MTYLDIALLAIMVLSGLFAMARGFVREVLSLAGWGIAAFLAYKLYPTFLPYVKDKISNEMIAMAVVLFAIFLVILILISLVTSRLSDMVLYSSLGFIDRGLGFVFGLVRGFLIMTIAYMLFNSVVPEDKGGRPDFVTNAKSLGSLKSMSEKIWSMLPENPTEVLKNKLEKK